MKNVIFFSLLALFLCSCNNNRKKVLYEEISAVVVDTVVSNQKCVWKTDFYVNEFDEPTEEKYIHTEVLGKFSNSVTTNSDLRVRILIDKKNIKINLYEYATNHPVKGRGFFNFKAKKDNGEIMEFKTYNSDNGSNFVEDEYVEKLCKFITYNGEIKFIGTNREYGTGSEYKFSLFNNSSLGEIVNGL